eukprot:1738990-Pyramimonas_sp.AAC.1
MEGGPSLGQLVGLHVASSIEQADDSFPDVRHARVRLDVQNGRAAEILVHLRAPPQVCFRSAWPACHLESVATSYRSFAI